MYSNGKYNKDSVKRYDSGDSDFNGSDDDSVKHKIVIKLDCPKSRDLWRQYFNYFQENMYNKDGGFKIFPFHLLVYFHHRDNRHQYGDYNPTTKSNITINAIVGECLIEWARMFSD